MVASNTHVDRVALKVWAGLSRLPATQKAGLKQDVVLAIVASAMAGETFSGGTAPLDLNAAYSIQTVLERFIPISRSKLYGEVRAKKLTIIKIDGRSMITGAEIAAYLAARRPKPIVATEVAPASAAGLNAHNLESKRTGCKALVGQEGAERVARGSL